MNSAMLLGVVFISASLMGCGNAKHDAFVTHCAAGGESKASCSCLYGMAKEDLSEAQLDLLAAMVAKDQKRLQQISESLGMVSRATALAKIGVVTAKAVASCDLKAI